ncbi:uncharacterized protein FOMMEDRAFT_161167 [Fomitiporia mediterranea MF3/22]|uniref:uncharacterized protein n=1 Tax=Fomitiporia mediterranea (strain MF3/22) TaxID=694068 RepID=UPI00044080BF|nr:uncharacterized protein FOMMEDRAFT_161167 [Fomitiporia mediterranea MF3/22]EJC98957.1 hypothetical protein FOMMEDRAFT_161167 [Fomitiporia mediterranea MF3/22]
MTDERASTSCDRLRGDLPRGWSRSSMMFTSPGTDYILHQRTSSAAVGSLMNLTLNVAAISPPDTPAHARYKWIPGFYSSSNHTFPSTSVPACSECVTADKYFSDTGRGCQHRLTPLELAAYAELNNCVRAALFVCLSRISNAVYASSLVRGSMERRFSVCSLFGFPIHRRPLVPSRPFIPSEAFRERRTQRYGLGRPFTLYHVALKDADIASISYTTSSPLAWLTVLRRAAVANHSWASYSFRLFTSLFGYNSPIIQRDSRTASFLWITNELFGQLKSWLVALSVQIYSSLPSKTRSISSSSRAARQGPVEMFDLRSIRVVDETLSAVFFN